MRTIYVGICALLLTVFMTVPATVAETGGYASPPGDLFIICSVEDVDLRDAAGLCLGGHIFDVPAGSATAEITINDMVTSDTAGYFQFEDSAGNTINAGPFCGGTTEAVPAGAASLGVFVSTAYAQLDCASANVGTVGDVVVTWS